MEKEIIDLVDSLVKVHLKDSAVIRSFSDGQWYNFYSNLYHDLVSSHVALFGALITIAVAIFGFKYWNDNVNLEKRIKELSKDIAAKEAEASAEKKAEEVAAGVAADKAASIAEAVAKAKAGEVTKEHISKNFDDFVMSMMYVFIALLDQVVDKKNTLHYILDCLQKNVYRCSKEHVPQLIFVVKKVIDKIKSWNHFSLGEEEKGLLKLIAEGIQDLILALDDEKELKIWLNEWDPIKRDIDYFVS